MKFFILLLAIVLCASPAYAADVDGKWTGTISTPGGDFPVTFDLKADGATLTGTTLGPDGTMIAIKNGTIDGAKIAFLVTLDFGGMALDINYSGVVAPAEIKMTAEVAGMPIEFAVKKAN